MMMSSSPVKAKENTDKEAIASFSYGLSVPSSLPLHVGKSTVTASSNTSTIDIPNTAFGSISFTSDTNPKPTVDSAFAVKSTKVNARDIALAIEDPFALPSEESFPAVNDSVISQSVHNEISTAIAAPMQMSSDSASSRIDVELKSKEQMAETGVETIRSQKDRSRVDNSVTTKPIVLDANEDAILSFSSSRRVPVTAETAVTADSSPSLQRDPIISAPFLSRHQQQPGQLSLSLTDVTATKESPTSAPVSAGRPVDIHSITDTVLAASACVSDDPVWSDSGRSTTRTSAIHTKRYQGGDPNVMDEPFQRKRPRPGTGNCPVRLNAYLRERYMAAPAMLFQLTDFTPDDLTRTIFERQIVHIPWNSPGEKAMSETPSIATMLHFCYAVSAWLHSSSTAAASMTSVRSSRHSSSPMAIVSCTNGKTRTAIAISCYLKFAGIVSDVQSGFCHFLERRCCVDPISRSPEDILTELPSSLRTFFRNFDCVIEFGGYINRKPLLLKAITLQGVPVDDRPCLDVWDASGHHVYSSHPHLWPELQESNMDHAPADLTHYATTSQWVDEEGFYRVNRVVQGDFCVLCRFGGDYAEDSADVSKILFRYANTTACMGAASPYELRYDLVDLQRRYARHFAEDDFLLSLLFDAHWNVENEGYKELLLQDCASDILPDVLTGTEAKELGWHLIARHHTAKPTEQDIDQLSAESLGELDGCPSHILSLALQLSNFDFTMALTILLEGRLRSWWQPQEDDSSIDGKEEATFSVPSIFDGVELLSHAAALINIRDILNDTSGKIIEPASVLTNIDSSISVLDSATSKSLGGNFYFSPLMRPNSGDVVCVLDRTRVSTLYHSYGSSLIDDQPLFPVVPHRRKRGNPIPIEHPNNDAAYDFFLKLNHPGVYLQDLIEFKHKFGATGEGNNQTPRSIAHKQNEMPSSTNFNCGHAGDSPNNLTCVPEVPISSLAFRNESGDAGNERLDTHLDEHDDPFKQNAVRQGVVETLSMDDHQVNQTKTSPDVSREDGNVAIKDDPALQKYFKMMKMGLPDGAVRNAMQRDGVDSSILDLDLEKTLKSQTKTESSAVVDDGVPIKDDPVFQKYFKMIKMGLPDGAVRNAMQRDGVDSSILDLDLEKSLKSQTKVESSTVDDGGVPIKDDPAFQKYFKMIKMGLPDGAIRNAMQRDEVDSSILDLDLEKSLKSQTRTESSPVDDVGVPIKDDPVFQKYFKMIKMGLPDGAIRNAMCRDGVDCAVLDLDPEKSLNSQTKTVSSTIDSGVPIKDDPAFQKYFKMIKMGLPDGAVRNAMLRDGADASILQLDHNRSLQSQQTPISDDSGPPLQEDPDWNKYFKMLQMGLPLGAVKNAAERDGKDSSVLDLDPSKSIGAQRKKASASAPIAMQKKKKPVKRKKIYWNPLNSGQIKANSLWSHVKGRLQMSQLKYDEKEFADLFTESEADVKNVGLEKQDKLKVKKSVQVIDGKRSMNGGIILARLKLDYSKIAEMVENMNAGKLDATSLQALKDMLPTSDERNGLLAFVKKIGSNDEGKKKAYVEFSECEKYMYTMLSVSDARSKYDCMLFRSQFKARYEELMESIEIVEKACDEVRSSERLQTVMAMILTLVNQINTGGDGNEAAGFTLDALLKLNEAKAFDKKTSVLHYLVKLIKRNDESLLGLREDLRHLKDAELVVLESLYSDIKSLKVEIEPVLQTVKSQAEFLEENGQLIQMSLKELAEQKTSVRTVASVPQYNKIDHHTGRTPMERFTLNAAVKIEQALTYTEKVKEKFSTVLEYFGEDGTTASNDFFGTMNAFLSDFTKAVDHVHTEDLAKRKNAAKEAKRVLAVEQKSNSLRIEKVNPPGNMTSLSGIAAIAESMVNKKISTSTETTEGDGSSSSKTVIPHASTAAAAAAARAIASKFKNTETRSPVVQGSAVASARINELTDFAHEVESPLSLSMDVNGTNTTTPSPQQGIAESPAAPGMDNADSASDKTGTEFLGNGNTVSGHDSIEEKPPFKTLIKTEEDGERKNDDDGDPGNFESEEATSSYKSIASVAREDSAGNKTTNEDISEFRDGKSIVDRQAEWLAAVLSSIQKHKV